MVTPELACEVNTNQVEDNCIIFFCNSIDKLVRVKILEQNLLDARLLYLLKTESLLCPEQENDDPSDEVIELIFFVLDDVCNLLLFVLALYIVQIGSGQRRVLFGS